MIPIIIDDLAVRDNAITGRYCIKCPVCGDEIKIFVELTKEGHFCYTAKTKNHKDCRLLDSDYFYFYACNPFPMQIAKIYYDQLSSLLL